MKRKRKVAPVTLKDVAHAAGVSYQTVSRAINDYDEISPKTRKSVLAVARRLGYRPNRIAASLRSNQSDVIGLIVSDIENVFFAEVAGGVEAEANSCGYSVLLANSSEDIVREHQAVRDLFERRVDGLIIAPAEGDHTYLRAELPRTFPIVAVNRMIDIARCGAVITENEQGARTAVQYLISRGHRKIGAIVGSTGLMTSRERLSGFRLAMAEANLPVRDEWLKFSSIRPEGARMSARAIFDAADHPTAMLTSSHRISEGLLLGLRDVGLRYGKDVEIVGFDDVPWAILIDPPLPVIAQPTHHIGRDAVRMLVGMIEGTAKASVTRLPTRLITHAEASPL